MVNAAVDKIKEYYELLVNDVSACADDKMIIKKSALNPFTLYEGHPIKNETFFIV